MSQLDRVEMHFSAGDEAPELNDYRPISPLVIVACIAGLMSLLAVVHPLLWFVPVVAAVLSVCAIRQVSTSQNRYGGRLAAVAALCFAVLIGAYAPARAISRERGLYRRAQTQVKDWISLVQQGRYQEAHQLSLGPRERFQGPGALADHYVPRAKPDLSEVASMDPALVDPTIAEPAGSEMLVTFLEEPIMAKLVAYGQECSVTHVADVSVKTTYGGVAVAQRFRVTGVREGQPESIEFLVKSTRWEALDHADWQVGDLREVD